MFDISLLNTPQKLGKALIVNTRCRQYMLALAVVLASHPVAADKTISEINQSEAGTVRIIEPKKEVPVAKSATIDTERFELGFATGFLAVEDFNVNATYGASLSYHITPKWLAQINYGRSDVDRANFESNAAFGGNFLADDDRVFEYYNVLAGYRVLRGRSFIGVNRKYNSDIYLLSGFGSVDFAGDSNTSITIGTSYRVVITDSLVTNLDIRAHSVDRDFLNDNKNTLNTEFVLGVNLLF